MSKNVQTLANPPTFMHPTDLPLVGIVYTTYQKQQDIKTSIEIQHQQVPYEISLFITT